MRVCMLIYYYWPHQVGGTENQCRRLVAELANDGIICEVLTSRYDICVSSHEMDNGINVQRMPTFETLLQCIHLKSRNQCSMYREKTGEQSLVSPDKELQKPTVWRKWLSSFMAALVKYGNVICFSTAVLLAVFRRRRSIDILHVHTGDWIAGLAAFAGRLINVKVVCKGANIPVFPELKQIPFSSILDRWRKRPHFIALTEAMKEDLMVSGVTEDKITRIPNGVRIPDEHADAGTNSTFLYVGNYSQTAAHKGFDVLIEAWAMVIRKRAEARLVMIGRGDSTPWWHLSKDLSCEQTIDFVGYQNELAPYFLSSCCLLLPSRKEGISNAVLEAQSYGLPVIASDLPGNTTVVVNEETGLIVEKGQAKKLAQAIVRLHDSPEERKRFGRAARIRICNLFSMQTVATQTAAIYKQLVD